MIVGLTDKVKASLPTIGKLKKGGPKPAKGPGKDTDHWRFVADNPQAVEDFVALYGEDPVSLHVYLPYRTLDQNWSAWQEQWGAEKLLHRCDGKTCVKWLDKEGKYHFEARPCPGNCKQVGRLSVILPEMVTAGHGGCVTVETHSINDILRLQAALLDAQDARADNPLGLRGVKFLLRRRKGKVGDGRGGKRDAWLISLERLDDSWVTAFAASVPMSERASAIVDPDTGEVSIEEPTVDEPPEEEDLPFNPAPPAAAPPPATAEPAKSHGNGTQQWPERPWPADVTRIALAAKCASKHLQTDDTSMQRGKLALINLYPDDELARHAIGLWLWGKAHSADWTPQQAEATAQWVRAEPVKVAGQKDKWVPSDLAVKEARLIVEAQAIAEGQQPLFVSGEPVQDPAY